jgi:tRNA pseudouridine65 synthase
VEIELIYEDDSIVVVNKPNNILVHPSYYARNIQGPTLIDILRDQLGKKPLPVHRLDYKTSGILIFAKDAEAAKSLQQEFEKKLIQKTYVALVRGHAPESGHIDTPVKEADSGIYREAETLFACKKHIVLPYPVQPYETSRYSLLELSPKTGRMHQLRKHMNKISHPIIGDHRYGNRHHNRLFADTLGYPNLFLHAAEIEFRHPVNDTSMKFSANFPDFWQNWSQFAEPYTRFL